MNSIFDMDKPFWKWLGKIPELVLLSLFWFICCIPVITIGPASSALYYVALKMVRKEAIRVKY